VIEDASAHPAFGWATGVVHAFRMPVFFFIAGFFGRSLRERRGTLGFARNRLARVLVPLVLGWLVFYPLVAFAWIWGSKYGGDPAQAVAALKAGYGSELEFLGRFHDPSELRGWFPVTHLWFLYVLLQIYVLFIPVRLAWVRWVDPAAAWREPANAWLRRAAGSAWLVPALALPSAVVLYRMRGWAIETPDDALTPHVPNLLLFGFVFWLGWLFHRQPELLGVLAGGWRRHLVVGAIAMCAVFALGGDTPAGPPPSPWPRAFRVGYMLVYATTMWSLLLASVGIAVRRCSRRSPTWRYLADSSYWVYIAHLPIVGALQVALSHVAGPAWGKFGLVTVTTAALCLASYHLLVRSTAIGVLLNGRRYSSG
jgi:peptidoglycan/LPS O-acetylase OafA/YrhL